MSGVAELACNDQDHRSEHQTAEPDQGRSPESSAQSMPSEPKDPAADGKGERPQEPGKYEQYVLLTTAEIEHTAGERVEQHWRQRERKKTEQGARQDSTSTAQGGVQRPGLDSGSTAAGASFNASPGRPVGPWHASQCQLHVQVLRPSHP